VIWVSFSVISHLPLAHGFAPYILGKPNIIVFLLFHFLVQRAKRVARDDW
jgi:hypothetical protein